MTVKKKMRADTNYHRETFKIQITGLDRTIDGRNCVDVCVNDLSMGTIDSCVRHTATLQISNRVVMRLKNTCKTT